MGKDLREPEPRDCHKLLLGEQWRPVQVPQGLLRGIQGRDL